MSCFLLSVAAYHDYFEAYDFIAGYSGTAALKWEAAMLEAFAHLASWPMTGKVRPEFAPSNVRFWTVEDHVVLYNPAAEPVEIIAILHGARNLSELIAARFHEDDSEIPEG